MKQQFLPKQLPVVADRRAVNWSRYWAHGSLHSLHGSYEGSYGGAVASFWRDVFATLPPSAQVLDLCTGNGAVPQLLCSLVDAGVQPPFATCDAIDWAEISPSWPHSQPASLQRCLHFHQQVRAEALPFESGRFDLVTSQYGVEYTDLVATLKEAIRVCRQDATIALVLHSTHARQVRLASIELQHIDALLTADGLLAATRRMLEPMARSRSVVGRESLASDSAANDAREAFNRVLSAVQGLADASPDGADLLHWAQRQSGELLAFAQRRGLEAAESAADDVERALVDARMRLQELCVHALTPDALLDLVKCLQGRFTHVETSELLDQRHVLGWTLRASPRQLDASTTLGA